MGGKRQHDEISGSVKVQIYLALITLALNYPWGQVCVCVYVLHDRNPEVHLRKYLG